MAQYPSAIQEKIDRINELQAQIETMRPIKPEYIARIFQKYRLEWNYNSNSIEGNSLNYGETVAFIMEGLTAKGKPLKDHLDIKGHNEAIDFLLDMQKKGSELMERDIRSLHEMILVEPYQSKALTADGQNTTKTIRLGVYKSSPNHVVTKTGETHFYASPEETPALMQELMEWYRESLPTMHPLILSAIFHHRFVNIHPFDDGNGRMSRLLSNLILMQAGFPPVVVRQDGKGEYYGVLSQADAGIMEPLVEYFSDLLIRSLEVYIKGAQGEDISEPDDLDKQIALFVSEFDEELLTRETLSRDALDELFDGSLLPLLSRVNNYMIKLSNLFHEYEIASSKETHAGVAYPYDLVEDYKVEEWLKPETGIKKMFIDDFYAEEWAAVRLFRATFILTGFKVNPGLGGFSFGLLMSFDTYDYSITVVGPSDNKLVKYYPRQMTKSEMDSVIKRALDYLMNKISNAAKSTTVV
jgi:Fic family protein